MSNAQPLRKIPLVVKQVKKKKRHDFHVALVLSLLLNILYSYFHFEHFIEWLFKGLINAVRGLM